MHIQILGDRPSNHTHIMFVEPVVASAAFQSYIYIYVVLDVPLSSTDSIPLLAVVVRLSIFSHSL